VVNVPMAWPFQRTERYDHLGMNKLQDGQWVRWCRSTACAGRYGQLCLGRTRSGVYGWSSSWPHLVSSRPREPI